MSNVSPPLGALNILSHEANHEARNTNNFPLFFSAFVRFNRHEEILILFS